MDGLSFINMFFQYAALNNFAKMLDGDGMVDGRDCIIETSMWPEEAQKAYQAADEAGQDPKWVMHHEHGNFITHTSQDEDDSPSLRMVCWAEMGPEKFNKTACEWWKAQGANPDKIVPGVTDLHRGKDTQYGGEDR